MESEEIPFSIESHKEQGHYVDEEQKLVIYEPWGQKFLTSLQIPQWMDIWI